MTYTLVCKGRSSIKKKSSDKRRFGVKMGAKVAVCEHHGTSASSRPCTWSESRHFERFRSSLNYWRESFLGGCNFIKAHQSKSRRKNEVNKENRNNANNQPVISAKKTGVVSASHSSSAKTRKATSSENCVADSFDDNMIDKLTEIPCGVDRNEWLATHTLDLFENISALCGTVYDHCTPVTCSSMSFPGCAKANWLDEKGKRHQYSAARYIDCVMSFCEAARKEAIFPTKYGMPFPSDFEQQCRRIVRLLWHCCGHLYTKHWDLMAVLNLRPQYGLVLAHLTAIAKLFVLLDSKELNSLTNTLCLVRPPCLQAPPAKRSGGVGDSQLSFSNSTAVVNPTTNSVNWTRVPTSKSGSWGGQSQSTSSIGSAVTAMPPLASNMSKNAVVHNSSYAQTC